MKSLLKHPVRVAGRLLWLGGELLLVGWCYLIRCAFRSNTSALVRRAAWLQFSARRFLRIFRLQPRISGPVPTRGLLVCNHLTYLDVLVLGALAPAVFVAKREVKHWPVFGWLASLAGTLYVHREKRIHVGRVTDEIQALLDRGVLVILFPEGTSSNGQTVLPFKSSLLEPATRQTHPLSAGLIQYQLQDGDVAEEVCYWKDMHFLPHLLNLLGKRSIQASVRFSQVRNHNANRKELAVQLRLEVLRLKETVGA